MAIVYAWEQTVLFSQNIIESFRQQLLNTFPLRDFTGNRKKSATFWLKVKIKIQKRICPTTFCPHPPTQVIIMMMKGLEFETSFGRLSITKHNYLSPMLTKPTFVYYANVTGLVNRPKIKLSKNGIIIRVFD